MVEWKVWTKTFTEWILFVALFELASHRTKLHLFVYLPAVAMLAGNVDWYCPVSTPSPISHSSRLTTYCFSCFKIPNSNYVFRCFIGLFSGRQDATNTNQPPAKPKRWREFPTQNKKKHSKVILKSIIYF